MPHVLLATSRFAQGALLLDPLLPCRLQDARLGKLSSKLPGDVSHDASMGRDERYIFTYMNG